MDSTKSAVAIVVEGTVVLLEVVDIDIVLDVVLVGQNNKNVLVVDTCQMVVVVAAVAVVGFGAVNNI